METHKKNTSLRHPYAHARAPPRMITPKTSKQAAQSTAEARRRYVPKSSSSEAKFKELYASMPTYIENSMCRDHVLLAPYVHEQTHSPSCSFPSLFLFLSPFSPRKHLSLFIVMANQSARFRVIIVLIECFLLLFCLYIILISSSIRFVLIFIDFSIAPHKLLEQLVHHLESTLGRNAYKISAFNAYQVLFLFLFSFLIHSVIHSFCYCYSFNKINIFLRYISFIRFSICHISVKS